MDVVTERVVAGQVGCDVVESQERTHLVDTAPRTVNHDGWWRTIGARECIDCRHPRRRSRGLIYVHGWLAADSGIFSGCDPGFTVRTGEVGVKELALSCMETEALGAW